MLDAPIVTNNRFILFDKKNDEEKTFHFFYFLDQRLSDQIHRLNLEFQNYYQEKKLAGYFYFS